MVGAFDQEEESAIAQYTMDNDSDSSYKESPDQELEEENNSPKYNLDNKLDDTDGQESEEDQKSEGKKNWWNSDGSDNEYAAYGLCVETNV